VLADNATAAAAAALLAQPARMRPLAEVTLLAFHEYHKLLSAGMPADALDTIVTVAPQLLQVLQQVASAAVAGGSVPPGLTLLAEALHAQQQLNAAGPAEAAAGVPADAAAVVGPSAPCRMLFLLQCLQPLDSCRQGLLALVPHVSLLQRAAAALSSAPVPEPYLQGQQLGSQQWAAQIGKKARAELAATKREHARAWRQLQCAIVGVAQQLANNRAAATARDMYVSSAAAVDQLAAALPRVVELEQLLLLAEGASSAAEDAQDSAGAAPPVALLAV
jgi:hypothetical protein